MPYYRFIWLESNLEHLAEHDVTWEEFEEVVCDPERIEKSRSSGRYIAFGYTSTGKYLACIYEMFDDVDVYPVTAYEPEE